MNQLFFRKQRRSCMPARPISAINRLHLFLNSSITSLQRSVASSRTLSVADVVIVCIMRRRLVIYMLNTRY